MQRSRHILITGGGSGIGLATAERFAGAGASVTIADKVESGAAASRIGAQYVSLDVRDDAAVERLAETMQQETNLPAVVVTSAGVLQRPLPPDELSWKEWDLMHAVHVRGSYACCRSFGSRMAQAGGGTIVMVSSVAGLRWAPLHAYGPAKAAIAQLTRNLAAEWGPRQVRVNAVAPGFTATPALAAGIESGTLDENVMLRQSALGRLVEPREIANAIYFLASGEASAITGVVLPVDAGHLVASDWNVYGGLR